MKIVTSKKLKYIFNNKVILDKTIIISFDSEFIYIWRKKKIHGIKPIQYESTNYYFYKINHNLQIKEFDRMGWKAGVWLNEIDDLLPVGLRKNDFEAPKICGSLYGDFVSNQKKIKGEKNNPYITQEGYLATIIHEFGHIYYQSHKNWWFSDKQKNLKLLKDALTLYNGANRKIKTKIEIPKPFFFSEVFAFCAEYETSEIFFPKHKLNIDNYVVQIINESVKAEQQKNLETEDSIFNEKAQHIIAFVIGKILLNNFSKTWPEIILSKSVL